MKESCRNYRSLLMDAAEGRPTPEVTRHLEECKSCSAAVERYREIVAAAKVAWTPAPADLIALVKNLIPETRRVWTAARLGSSLAAGARGLGDEFQMSVGGGDLSIRIMATRSEAGWQLMGRLPEGEWSIDAEVPAVVDANGFRFTVGALEESGFNLIGPDQILVVPAMSQLLGDDGR
ncbi:anti-sigma factor family protein [Fimbriimonas ginsengisoli]|uniref:Zinc-finger domain-containing protein n=1 Tax=Fimbriimonas ginsengisoli Gsoil 348 TaxID=661478 RepID=A0A068NSZ4_FIMGI|nr:zf-HC2 domain-containing protein [Fimbriimonas ginsengisoli]AIE84744.1 hypothetical protein OP10G_1376 [Fimbriimonas ginsengisoli Gsoil 348]